VASTNCECCADTLAPSVFWMRLSTGEGGVFRATGDLGGFVSVEIPWVVEVEIARRLFQQFFFGETGAVCLRL
jgi:hypothetical protein